MKSGHFQYPNECKVAIKTVSGADFVNAKQILYFESSNIYSTVYFIDGTKVTCLNSLIELEENLPQSYFLRVHKKFIINVSKIVKYKKNDGGSIKLDNGVVIPLSRTRKPIFFAMLVNHF